MSIRLTEENRKAEAVPENHPYPDHPERFHEDQVLCEEGLTGRHYWEVEYFSADIAVAYKSINRMPEFSSYSSSDYGFGDNEKSWCFKNPDNFAHNKSFVNFIRSRNSAGVMGVYLDWPAGILSFFEISPDTVTHLYTVHTTFTEPLHPGFAVYFNGSVSLCKIK